MKIVLFTTVVLMAMVVIVQTAPGDGVLTGYLLTNTDHCVTTAGNAVAAPTSLSQANLATGCLRLYLVEAASGYLIKKSATQADVLNLADTTPATFEASGTAVQFTDGTRIFAPTSADVWRITDLLNPVKIQLEGTTASASSCLKLDLTYSTSSCTAATWYFIKADCLVSDCATCNVDATLCDACTPNTHVLSGDKKTCQAMTTEATTASDAGINTISVLVIFGVGMALLIMA